MHSPTHDDEEEDNHDEDEEDNNVDDEEEDLDKYDEDGQDDDDAGKGHGVAEYEQEDVLFITFLEVFSCTLRYCYCTFLRHFHQYDISWLAQYGQMYLIMRTNQTNCTFLATY